MNNIDKWIEQTIDSMSSIKSAEVSVDLNKKIIDAMFQQKVKVISIQPQITWSVAASLLFLLGLNFLSIVNYNKTETKVNESNSYEISKVYFSYTEQF